MSNLSQFGKILIAVGGVLILSGIIIVFVGKIPILGKLPGDMTIRKGNLTIYIPIVTCILASLILTLIIYLLRK